MILLALLLWLAALHCHALRQPKMQRLRHRPPNTSPYPAWGRLFLPLAALAVCLQKPLIEALELWLGTFSAATLAITLVWTLRSRLQARP